MSTCGEATARTMRSVIGWRSIRSLEWTLATTTSSLAEHVVVVIERAVLEDVDLDAGEDPERRHLLVERGHIDELLLQPLLAQPVGDRQARRMIGQHHVVVAETACGASHRLDRRSPVAPRLCRWQSPFSAARYRAPSSVTLTWVSASILST